MMKRYVTTLNLWNLRNCPRVCTKRGILPNKYEGNKYSDSVGVNKQNIEFYEKWSCIDQLLTGWN